LLRGGGGSGFVPPFHPLCAYMVQKAAIVGFLNCDPGNLFYSPFNVEIILPMRSLGQFKFINVNGRGI
jgi:hypothetical protein